MQNTLLKVWGIEPLHMAKQLTMSQSEDFQTLETNLGTRKPIIKLPLHFTYLPVEIISKQLTKLNSKYKERIIYLGPRWQQSFQWHKKFSKPVQPKTQTTEENITSGYYFNQRRVVRNNSFIHDSMRQNRFFKNQIYYRAFEGMNPTINDSEEIVFESKFQSGNLDCVVKIDQNQYDLFLRIDTNTRGNLFWYYFTIKLPTESKMKSKVVRLNICNITKSRTLYEKNLRPYVKRRKNNDTSNDRLIDNWIQGDGIKNCKIKQKKLRYKFIYQKIKTSLLHELSFQIQLKYDQQVSLAYCIPYTYSFLMSQLSQLQKQLQSRNIKKVFINKLGQSLTGVQIPMITIGDVRDVQSNNDDKKVVFITGRAHPGESNSSLILSSLINQLCLKKLDQILESRVVFVIIPMLNPDGVIFGNGRSTALGRDINRQFKVWNSFLNPQVVAVKKLIDKIQQYYEIQMYFDFHGHSKKKNIFFFGPAYSVADPNYYRCRVFPKILSRNLDFFRYYGCSYVIPESKMTTARSVMLNEFNIPFFYTVETSVGFYHDYAKRQDVPFDKASLFKIGLKFKQSIKQYFQGVEQYELYLKNKKKQKNLKTQLALKQLTQKDPSNQDQKISNLKFIKVFEEIKTETKNLEKAKKQQISDSDSDSCRVQEQMQVEKVKEFSQMVITFNKIQIQKIRKTEIIPVDEENQHLSKRKQNKKKASKHHSQLNDDIASLLRRFTTKNQPQFRIHSNSMKIDFPRTSRLKQSVQLANQFSQDQKNLILPEHPKKSIRISSPDKKLKQLNISAHNFFRRNDLDLQSQEGQRIGVLNFSSMVQNPKSLRYSQDHTKFRASSRGQKRKIITNIEEEKSRINSNLTKFFFPFSEEKDQFLADQFGQGGIRNSNNPKPYPASFYRIKYQSSHKKYRDKSPEPVVSSFRRFQQERISFSPKKQQKNTKNAVFREPQKLFINISKIAN